MLKKLALFLPITGSSLYLILIVFILYAINHPEGGFPISVKTTHLIYLCYTIIMFISLVCGSILLFMKGLDNEVQKIGARIFLISVILLILFSISTFLVLFTQIEFYPFLLLLYSNGVYLLYVPVCLILFIVGITLSRYQK